MSAYGDLVEVLTVKRSELVGKAKALVSVFFDTPPRDPQDDSSVPGDEIAEPAEWWQSYGFVSRPPKGAEALVVRAGATVAAIASRLIGGESAYGKLQDGDAALYTVGGNTIRLAVGGAISMLVPSKGKQVVFRIDPKGSFQVMLANGFCMELSEANGFVVSTPGKDVNLAGKNIVTTGTAFINNSGIMQTTRTAAVPLATGPITKANPGLLI